MKGKANVNLTKLEMAALDRRRERIEKEAEKERKKKKKKGSGSSSDRKKKKEDRVAVPLSRLEPVSRKKKSSPPSRESPAASRRPSSTDLTRAQQEEQVYPPMGYFPPPSGRSRPRSGTSLSQRPPSRLMEERGPSPFNHDYTQRPGSANRHVSENIPRPHSRGMAYDPQWGYGYDYSPPSSAGSRDGHDPFQYQTAGPRAPYSVSGAAAVSRRHVSGPADAYMSRRSGATAGAPAAARGHPYPRSGRGDESSATDSQTSEESSTSDELGRGAQIREPASRGRGEIVVEASPDRGRDPHSSKKKSSSSPVKRKPVAGGGAGGNSGGRRRRR